MALVTKAVRQRAATIELVMESEAKLMDALEILREVARRLDAPVKPPANVVAFRKAA